LMGLASGHTWRVCSANSLGAPGMSVGHQVNIFQRSWRNLMTASSYAGLGLVDTRDALEESVGCT
jgi:hypothetical protein